MERLKNIFYFHDINSIGGVETFFYYLARNYCDRDITVFYKTGNIDQILRLGKYVRVKKYSGEKIFCEKAFFNYHTDIIDDVDAYEYIQIIHADYRATGLKYWFHPKITRILGVSQAVCDVVKQMSGRDCELAYNPIYIEKPRKFLHLVSATRLTPDKGKERMKTLAAKLDAADIPYVWLIYTDSVDFTDNKRMVFLPPKLSITSELADADFLVQLSNAEGYCYTVVEALSVGTPVIVTDLPVYKELGLNEKNSIKLPLDMSYVPVNKIARGLGRVSYTPPADRWGEILAEGASTYQEDLKRVVEVRAINKYFDLELKRIVERGTIISVPYERAEKLSYMNLVEEV